MRRSLRTIVACALVCGIISTLAVIQGGTAFASRATPSGIVSAWGFNYYGQIGNGTTTDAHTPVTVPGLSGVIAIAGGQYHSLALKSDGSVWAWGKNAEGELGDGSTTDRSTPVQVSSLTGVSAIASGYNHSLALKADGSVWAWGSNTYGELGDGTTTNRSVPVQVSGLSAVLSLAGGLDDSIALKADGSVWTWGYNASGQLGNGTNTNSSSPVQVSNLSGVIAIAGGQLHSLALKANGTAWTWGGNVAGQLGNGTTTGSNVPVQVSGLSNAVAISAGDAHSVALKSDGSVWTWGSNHWGQLGNGTTTDSSIPLQVSGLSSVVSIAAGGDNCFVIETGGKAWAWGYNGYGQIGDGSTTDSHSPVQVTSLSGVVAISSGRFHNLALRLPASGTGVAWGLNDVGELGNNSTTNSSVPVPVSNLSSIVALASGSNHSLAVRSDGSAWAWGYNIGGQLGNGSLTDSHVPVQVSGLSGVTAISGGDNFSLALKSDGSVWGWGYNYHGQLGNGSTTNSSVPVQATGLSGVIAIAAAVHHSLALKLDGTVWAWGQNNYGQLGNGATADSYVPVQVSGLSGVEAIRGGYDHSLALKSDGTVWAWGYNAFGELGNGSTTDSHVPIQVSGLSSAVSIASGSNHNLASTSDGSLWAWGYNRYGQLGNGSTTDSHVPIQVSGLSSAVSIADGYNHSLASTFDGSLWAWGYNAYGQLGNGSTTDNYVPARVKGLSNAVSMVGGAGHSLAVTPPVPPSISSPSNGSISTVATATVSGTAPANATVAIVESGSILTQTAADGSGNWSTTISFTNGRHVIRSITLDANNDESFPSAAVGFEIFVPPSAPQNLSASPGSSQITLSWSRPSSDGGSPITNYKIYRSTISGAETLLTQVGNVLTYTDTGLTNGTTYFYKVSAVTLAGEGAQSNEASATPVTVPSAPQNLTAVFGNAQNTLNWSAPASNGGSAITNYKIYRSTSSGSETLLTQVGNITSYSDSGLTNGTTYFYKVSAVNAVGESPQSNEAFATPTAAPSAPQNLTATSGNAQITLNWSAPVSNGGSAVTNYKIYRSTSSGTETLVTQVGNVLTYTDTGLANGTAYYYKVSAVNTGGESAQSNEASATPMTVPSAPNSLTAASGNAQNTLNWSAPASNGGSPVTNYKIYRGTSTGAETLLTQVGNVTTFTDTTLINGTTYYYKVSAVNTVGEGAQSNEASATPATTPLAPQGVSATAGNQQVRVSWSAPPSNGGAPITNYKIYRSTSSGSETLLGQIGNVTSYTDTGLTNGTTYFYKVSAVNVVGEGAQSSEVSATPATAPSAPQNLSVTSGNAQNALSWSAPASNGGSAITGYKVYRGTSSGSEVFLKSIGAGTTSYADTGLTNGTTYYYRVSAYNAAGEGTQSNEASGTPVTVPDAPLTLSASASQAKVSLSWNSPASNGGTPITHYNIYRSTASNTEVFLEQIGNATSYTDTAVDNDTTYFYKVSAVNAVGEGSKSNEASAKPIYPTTMSVSPTSIDFGTTGTRCDENVYSPNEDPNHSDHANSRCPVQQVILTNQGPGHLYNVKPHSDTYPFKMIYSNCSLVNDLPPNASCIVAIEFQPDYAGPVQGFLAFTADDAKLVYAQLNGVGVQPTIQAPQKDDFGIESTGCSFVDPNHPEAVTPSEDPCVTNQIMITNNGPDTIDNFRAEIHGDAGFWSFYRPESCSYNLRPGTSCLITIEFAPTRPGSFASTLLLSGDNLDPVSVSLTGTGVNPAMHASTNSYYFQPEGNGCTDPTYPPPPLPDYTCQTTTITLYNDGPGDIHGLTVSKPDLPFRIVTPSFPNLGSASTCGSNLSEGASCSVEIEFGPFTDYLPKYPRTWQSVLTFAGPNGQLVSVQLSGTSSPPQWTAPQSVDFDIAAPGCFAFGPRPATDLCPRQTVTLDNPGLGDVRSMQAVKVSGDGFKLIQSSCPGDQSLLANHDLPAQTDCGVELMFQPDHGGSYSGTLTFTSANAPDITVALTGSGAQPNVVATKSPANIPDADTNCFNPETQKGDQTNICPTQTITFNNMGPGALYSVAAEVDKGSTSFNKVSSSCTGDLHQSTTCLVEVRFKPALIGSNSGILHLTANYGFALDVTLSGKGVYPAMTAPSSVDFGSVSTTCNNTKPGSDPQSGLCPIMQITVTNKGPGSIYNLGVSQSGDSSFSVRQTMFALSPLQCQSATGPANVPPNTSCYVAVQFAPRSTGQKVGSLTFTGTAGNGAALTLTPVHLTGSGALPMVTPSTDVHNFGSVSTGCFDSLNDLPPPNEIPGFDPKKAHLCRYTTISITNHGPGAIKNLRAKFYSPNGQPDPSFSSPTTDPNTNDPVVVCSTGQPNEVAPMVTCHVTVEFHPTSKGGHRGSLEFLSDSVGPIFVGLAGYGT